MLYARLLGGGVQILRLGERGGNRLLAVDVLAGSDGALQQLRTQLRRSGVEEDLVSASQRGVEVCGPARYAVCSRQLLDLAGVAADEQRIGHQARAVLERHAALLSYFQD